MNKIKEDIKDSGLSMPQTAIKFALANDAMSTVITGIRSVKQSEMNASVSDLDDLSGDVLLKLRNHEWRRGFWYSGK